MPEAAGRGVPDISLGVQPTNVAPPGLFGSGMNPLDALGKLASTQNALNQNKLFQQQFQAKQVAGQILANSKDANGNPDLEGGIKSLYSNPRTAAFAGEIAAQVKQQALFEQQVQNERQTSAQSGLEAGSKGISAASDPSMLPNLIAAYKKTMSPTTLKTSGPALDLLAESMLSGTQGLPPDQAAKKFAANRIALGVGAGVPVDSLLKQYATPTMVDVHSGLKPMQINPGFLGGGATSAGPEMPFGVPMNVQPTPGGGSVPRAGITGEGNPLMPGMPAEPSARAPASTSAAPVDSLGKPLYEGSLDGMAPQVKGTTNLTPGLPIRSPAQEENNKVLLTKYNSEGYDQFRTAQQGLGLLNLQDKAFDKINAGGGWQTSGYAGEARNAYARAANTVAQMTGSVKPDGSPDLPFDPGKVASWEDIVKNTNTLAGMLSKQYFGGNHTAAETVNKVVASVPSISNSPLGAKLVSDGLKSTMNRVIDERNFTNEYKNANAGSIDGAAEAFNKTHSPTYYTDAVLAKYGMDENGFKSEDDIGRQLQSGLITPAQAKAARAALPKAQ